MSHLHLTPVLLKCLEHGRTVLDICLGPVVLVDKPGHQGEDVVEEVPRDGHDAFQRVAEDDVALEYGSAVLFRP